MTAETTTSAADSEQPQIRDAVNDLARMLEAVRYTTGLGAKQMERVEKAKQIAIKAEADRASLLAEVERLRVALEPFSKFYLEYDLCLGVGRHMRPRTGPLYAFNEATLTVEDFKSAALASTGKGKP